MNEKTSMGGTPKIIIKSWGLGLALFLLFVGPSVPVSAASLCGPSLDLELKECMQVATTCDVLAAPTVKGLGECPPELECDDGGCGPVPCIPHCIPVHSVVDNLRDFVDDPCGGFPEWDGCEDLDGLPQAGCEELDCPPVDTSDLLNILPSSCGTALPVSPVITGNGGSTIQLFQDKVSDGTVFGRVYATYSLKTNNINNGADLWAFGYQIGGPVGDNEWEYGGVMDNQFGVCVDLGLAPWKFDYFIDAGAMGWSTSTSCSWSVNWQTTVGVQISIQDAGASAEISLGGSTSCSDGSQFDSESLLRGTGSSSL